MASGSVRAPKQWLLSKQETLTSYEAWKGNLLYTLSLDPNFKPFIEKNIVWKSHKSTNRGLADEGTIKAATRAAHLELMLGQIANYCPVIARSIIVKNSTSLDGIWQVIRSHFGFQSSGGHFLDISDIVLEQDERHEDLFQRLTAFFEDNLLTKSCGITHNGESVDEEFTATVENVIVYLWLSRIHEGLPKLIKQRYATELRSKSLASIKNEISCALSSLLEELKSSEESRVCKVYSRQRPQQE